MIGLIWLYFLKATHTIGQDFMSTSLKPTTRCRHYHVDATEAYKAQVIEAYKTITEEEKHAVADWMETSVSFKDLKEGAMMVSRELCFNMNIETNGWVVYGDKFCKWWPTPKYAALCIYFESLAADAFGEVCCMQDIIDAANAPAPKAKKITNKRVWNISKEQLDTVISAIESAFTGNTATMVTEYLDLLCEKVGPSFFSVADGIECTLHILTELETFSPTQAHAEFSAQVYAANTANVIYIQDEEELEPEQEQEIMAELTDHQKKLIAEEALVSECCGRPFAKAVLNIPTFEVIEGKRQKTAIYNAAIDYFDECRLTAATRKERPFVSDVSIPLLADTGIKKRTHKTSADLHAEKAQKEIKAFNRKVKAANTQRKASQIGAIKYNLTDQGLAVTMPKIAGVKTSTFIRSYLKKKGVSRLGRTLDDGVFFSLEAANEVLTIMKLDDSHIHDIALLRSKGYSLREIARKYDLDINELAEFCARHNIQNSEMLRRQRLDDHRQRDAVLWDRAFSVFGVAA